MGSQTPQQRSQGETMGLEFARWSRRGNSLVFPHSCQDCAGQSVHAAESLADLQTAHRFSPLQNTTLALGWECCSSAPRLMWGAATDLHDFIPTAPLTQPGLPSRRLPVVLSGVVAIAARWGPPGPRRGTVLDSRRVLRPSFNDIFATPPGECAPARSSITPMWPLSSNASACPSSPPRFQCDAPPLSLNRRRAIPPLGLMP